MDRRELLKLTSAISLASLMPAYLKPPELHPAENPDAKNVLIIVFDAFSALHLSLLGYERKTDLNITRFADVSTVYHNHFSGGIFTTTGTSTLLTGAYPFTHRAIQLNDTVSTEFENQNIFSAFDDYYRVGYSHNMLANTLLTQFQGNIDYYKARAELFFRNDFLFNTVFKGDSDNAYLSWTRVMHNEEDNYANSLLLSNLYGLYAKQMESVVSKDFPRGVPSNQGDFFLLENATDWIVSQIAELPDPSVSYIHLIPPHHPYNTRIDFYNHFMDDGYQPVKKPEHFFSQGISYDTLVKRRRYYDEFILYIDHEFGRLYDGLSAAGLLDDTWLVLTSDHGEMFERGIWEHTVPTIHQPVIRVPLLISAPGQQERQDVFSPTSSIDLLPTLLHLNGKDIPDWCEGEILPPYRSTEPDLQRNIFAIDAKKNEKYKPLNKATTMILEWPYKLVRYTENKNIPGYMLYYEMFNIEEDPEELNDLYSPESKIAKELIEKLEIRINKADEPYL